MKFNDIQMEELKKPLSEKAVKTLPSGSKAQYVEGYHVISEANRIFGFDGWSLETVYNREVCRQDAKIGKNQDDGFKVGYEAKVRIAIGDMVKEGTGHGSGIAKDLFTCIEGAAKEAETDATKRALRLFGNVFGLALYDKTKKNVANIDIYDNEQNRNDILADKIKKLIKNAKTLEEVNKVWTSNATDIASIKKVNKDKYKEIEKQFKEKKIGFNDDNT